MATTSAVTDAAVEDMIVRVAERLQLQNNAVLMKVLEKLDALEGSLHAVKSEIGDVESSLAAKVSEEVAVVTKELAVVSEEMTAVEDSLSTAVAAVSKEIAVVASEVAVVGERVASLEDDDELSATFYVDMFKEEEKKNLVTIEHVNNSHLGPHEVSLAMMNTTMKRAQSSKFRTHVKPSAVPAAVEACQAYYELSSKPFERMTLAIKMIQGEKETVAQRKAFNFICCDALAIAAKAASDSTGTPLKRFTVHDTHTQKYMRVDGNKRMSPDLMVTTAGVEVPDIATVLGVAEFSRTHIDEELKGRAMTALKVAEKDAVCRVSSELMLSSKYVALMRRTPDATWCCTSLVDLLQRNTFARHAAHVILVWADAIVALAGKAIKVCNEEVEVLPQYFLGAGASASVYQVEVAGTDLGPVAMKVFTNKEAAEACDYEFAMMERVVKASEGTDIIVPRVVARDATTLLTQPVVSPFTRRTGALFTRRLYTQLMQVVRVLHKAGIVHMDIKPINLGLADNGQLVLLDYGCSVDVGTKCLGFGQRTASDRILTIGKSAMCYFADDLVSCVRTAYQLHSARGVKPPPRVPRSDVEGRKQAHLTMKARWETVPEAWKEITELAATPETTEAIYEEVTRRVCDLLPSDPVIAPPVPAAGAGAGSAE